MLQRKVDHVLSLSLDSSDMITSTHAIANFADINDAKITAGEHKKSDAQSGEHIIAHSGLNRRMFKGAVERNGLTNIENFIDSFRPIINQISAVHNGVETLSSSCNELHTLIRESKKSTNSLLSQTKALQTERLMVNNRLETLETFMAHFTLTPAEETALDSSTVDEAFFCALERIDVVRERCKDLLRQYHQRAGLDVMDSLAHRLEVAFDTLCRWSLTKCRSLTSAQPELPPHLSRALLLLRSQPTYFTQCVAALRSCRAAALLQRFQIALQAGGAGGVPPPIEVHAHDTLRYCADMLAFVHQQIATERELAFVLYGIDETHDAVTAATAAANKYKQKSLDKSREANNDDDDDDDEHTNTINSTAQIFVAHLCDVCEGVRRPLTVRVENAIDSEDDTVLCYQLYSLLSFYLNTLRVWIPESAPICIALDDLKRKASHHFFMLLEQASVSLLRVVPKAPSSLAPSPVVVSALEQVARLLRSYDASLAVDIEQFRSISSATLDPLLQLTTLSAVELDTADTAVYHINTIACIQNTLRPYDFANTRLETLSLQLLSYMNTLIITLTHQLLSHAALDERIAHINELSSSTHIHHHQLRDAPGFDALTLGAALRIFYRTLFNSLSWPCVERVMHPRLRAQARQGVSVRVAQAYRELYDAIQHEQSGYDEEERKQMLQHSPQQLSTLLGATDTMHEDIDGGV